MNLAGHARGASLGLVLVARISTQPEGPNGNSITGFGVCGSQALIGERCVVEFGLILYFKVVSLSAQSQESVGTRECGSMHRATPSCVRLNTCASDLAGGSYAGVIV